MGGDVPRQQLLDASDGMIGDAAEDVAEIRLGIQTVEFSRSDQTIEDSIVMWTDNCNVPGSHNRSVV
jgi:hypothetical protein